MTTPLADRDPIASYRIQQVAAGWVVTFDDGTQGGPFPSKSAADRVALDNVTTVLDGMMVVPGKPSARAVVLLPSIVVPS